MGKHIKNAQNIVSIVWSIFILILVIIFIYMAWKKQKKEKTRSSLKTRVNKAAKHENLKSIEEDTTMIEYPEYNLKKESNYFLDHNKVIKTELYNYNDLLRSVKDNIFIEGYVKSLRIALQDKRKIYKSLMEKSTHAYEIEKAKASNNNNSLVLPILEAEYVEFPLILRAIDKRLKILSVEHMRDEFERMLWHKKYGLETIIGRRDIKNFIAEEIFSFYRDPKPSYTTIRNFSIMGPSGIGKNKLGESLSYAYCKSGILARNKFTIMNSHDLVSQFVSGTAHLVHNRLISHLEAMILIDEAYQLTTPNIMGTADHGKEAITAIVAFITKYVGLSRYGALGYIGPMKKQFYGANEGMERRFPHKIILTPYSAEELTEILIRLIAESSNIFLSDSEANALFDMIKTSLDNNGNVFEKQAGDMQNLAGMVCQTISTLKNTQWIDGNSKNNIDILLIGFNRYLKQINQPLLSTN